MLEVLHDGATVAGVAKAVARLVRRCATGRGGTRQRGLSDLADGSAKPASRSKTCPVIPRLAPEQPGVTAVKSRLRTFGRLLWAPTHQLPKHERLHGQAVRANGGTTTCAKSPLKTCSAVLREVLTCANSFGVDGYRLS
jgi:hypothetical protein